MSSVVVMTRLDARGIRGVRGVVRQTGRVVDDCRSVPGFLGGRLAVDPRRLLWTLTVWDSPAALRRFRELHASVAAGLHEVARDSAMQAYRQEGREVPAWRTAAEHTTIGRPRLALQRAVPGAVQRSAAGAA